MSAAQILASSSTSLQMNALPESSQQASLYGKGENQGSGQQFGRVHWENKDTAMASVEKTDAENIFSKETFYDSRIGTSFVFLLRGKEDVKSCALSIIELGILVKASPGLHPGCNFFLII